MLKSNAQNSIYKVGYLPTRLIIQIQIWESYIFITIARRWIIVTSRMDKDIWAQQRPDVFDEN